MLPPPSIYENKERYERYSTLIKDFLNDTYEITGSLEDEEDIDDVYEEFRAWKSYKHGRKFRIKRVTFLEFLDDALDYTRETFVVGIKRLEEPEPERRNNVIEL